MYQCIAHVLKLNIDGDPEISDRGRARDAARVLSSVPMEAVIRNVPVAGDPTSSGAVRADLLQPRRGQE
jgi:hypothetical protein